MTDRTGIERRGQVGLVGENFITTSLVFAVRDRVQLFTRWWLGNIRRPAHNRRHQVILLHARPTGSIANGGVIVDVVLKTHSSGVGGRIVVIGIRAVKVMSINFSE